MARKGPQNDETIASFLTFFTTSVSYNESKYVVFPNMCFVNMSGSQVSLSSGRGCQLGYFFFPAGDTWQSLETYISGLGLCVGEYWHLEGGGQGCC